MYTRSIRDWLSLPMSVRIIFVVDAPDRRGVPHLVVAIAPRRRTAACPVCGRCARCVHSRYDRTLTDVSVQCHSIMLRALVRRFMCRNKRCPCRIFCERLPDLAQAGARRTERLNHHLEAVGLALGGRPGQRLCELQGQPVNRQSLVRCVRSTPETGVCTPRFLGVDDWAMRKGCRYGTILYDLEAHRPVDLLPDRTAQSLAKWLQSHPGVEVISRDRANAYAQGAKLGAPCALQVADRFHLAKNLGDAVERLLNRHRATLRQAWKAGQKEDTERDGAVEESIAVEAYPVPIADSQAPTRDNATRQSRYEDEKRIRRAWRYGRYEQIKAHYKDGLNISEIARAMHLGRKTVSRLLRADVFPDRKPYSRRRSLLDDFVPDIKALWGSGCHNAAAIFRELKTRGYSGHDATVRVFVHTLRKPKTVPQAPAPTAKPETEPDRCSPRLMANLVLKKPETRRDRERELLSEVDRICEPFAAFHDLAQRFLDLLRAPKDKGSSTGFSEWMADASGSNVSDVRRFARGLEQDRAAVEAAMALPWSNGPVEGSVARLKSIKRQMYGRANFDLLRKRVLAPG